MSKHSDDQDCQQTDLSDPPCRRDLSRFDNSDYHPGRGKLLRLLWYFVSAACFESCLLPLSGPKRTLLRWFGATIGRGVVIKTHVRIKYPWRLHIGDHTWIGQDAWLDNLADIRIGSHVCISQGVYLCTGSHDHLSPTFNLIVRPITVDEGSWICARATLLPGVAVGARATVAAGCVVAKDVLAGHFVAGVPARTVRS